MKDGERPHGRLMSKVVTHDGHRGISSSPLYHLLPVTRHFNNTSNKQNNVSYQNVKQISTGDIIKYESLSQNKYFL